MFKRSAALLVLTCGFVISMTCTLHAQVCVVDVAKVFESDPQFNASLENLKQQAEAYKLSLQQAAEQLRVKSALVFSFADFASALLSVPNKFDSAALCATALCTADRASSAAVFL